MDKSLFEYWQEFAIERGGTCRWRMVPLSITGGKSSIRNCIIRIPYQDGIIRYRISKINPTKIQYYFNTNVKKEFLIYHEDWMDKIGKRIGLSEFNIDIPEFDNKFMILGSNIGFLHHVLDKYVRDFLLNDKNLSNFRLSTKNKKSLIELNAPFSESNLGQFEKTYDFLVRVVDNILSYNKTKRY